MANLFLNSYVFNLKPLYMAELRFFSPPNLTLFYMGNISDQIAQALSCHVNMFCQVYNTRFKICLNICALEGITVALNRQNLEPRK